MLVPYRFGLFVIATGAGLALCGCYASVERNVPDGDTGPCTGVDCSGHGVCVVRDDIPHCLCDSGYHAVGLACIADAADGDADADVDMTEDAGVDADVDELVSECGFGSGWGAYCYGEACADGSDCVYHPHDDTVGICNRRCSEPDEPCPDSWPGEEDCIWTEESLERLWCLILCEVSSDCPCDFECLVPDPAGPALCYPPVWPMP